MLMNASFTTGAHAVQDIFIHPDNVNPFEMFLFSSKITKNDR